MATGRQWYSRASATSGLRASGWTLVASTTVSLPRGEPLGGDEVQHLEGVVGRGLVVLVVATQAAAGVGRQHLGRLEVLPRERGLARAAGPIEDDEGQLGDGDLHVGSRREHRHLRRRADLGVLGPDRQEAHARSRSGLRRRRPSLELGARPLEAVVRWRNLPAGSALEAHVVLGVRRREDDGRRAARTRTAPARTRRAAAGRGARSPRPRPRRRSPASRSSR